MKTSKKVFQPAVLLVVFFLNKNTCLKFQTVFLCVSEQSLFHANLNNAESSWCLTDSTLAHEILQSNSYKIICCPLITHPATLTLPKHSAKSTLKIANTDTKGSVPFLPLLNYRMWLKYKCQFFIWYFRGYSRNTICAGSWMTLVLPLHPEFICHSTETKKKIKRKKCIRSL